MTIAQEWWDRKSMGCLWPPCCKGSYSMTTTSVNKNNGSEDTFRVFRCFYCKVKSSFDLLFVTQKSVLQKKNGMALQWCLHIYSPQQGVSVSVIRVQHCSSPSSCCCPSAGRESRPWRESPQHLQIFQPQRLKSSDQEQWLGLSFLKLNERRKHWPTYALVQSS